MQNSRPTETDVSKPRRGRPPLGHASADPDDQGRKAAILRAALDVFARDGYDGASLPKIAEAANVGHPLILYHFASKENLWRKAVANSLGGIVAEAAAIEVACRGLPPIDRLKALIHAFAIFAARFPSHFAILMFETRSRSERLTWLAENYINPFGAQWVSVFEEARAKGQIKDIPVDNLIPIFMGSVISYFSVNLQPLPDRPIEDIAHEHAAYVVDVLLNGIMLPD